MLYASPITFFICSDNHSDSLGQGQIHVFHDFQRVECRHCRAFVINGAPCINPSVADFSWKWITRPPISRRHDVNMAKYADNVIALPPFNMTCEAVKIFVVKPSFSPSSSNEVRLAFTPSPNGLPGPAVVSSMTLLILKNSCVSRIKSSFFWSLQLPSS